MLKEPSARRWFEVAATSLVAIAAIAVIVRSVTAPRGFSGSGDATGLIEPLRIEIGASPTLGNRSAAVGLVVFSDFECPFCREFALTTLPTLKRQFIDTGQVLLVFKHFPLVAIHPDARRASELAACAGSNESFWLTHDWLFQPSTSIVALRLETIAASVPVNVKTVEKCLELNGGALVEDDIVAGKMLGVRSTPEVLIGAKSGEVITATRRLRGLQHIEVFGDVIVAVAAAGR